MAQFARPTADTLNEGYTTQVGGTTNLFDTINESVTDDGDYIQTAIFPTSDVYVAALGAIEDPLSSSGHQLQYRFRKSATGGAQIDITVELRQGYVDEATQGTLIASYPHANISETFTTATQTLTGPQADAITNYAALFLRFVGNQV